MRLYGLTGGIASGKTQVAEMLRAQGVPVLDADAIARKVVEPGKPTYQDIASRWPQVIGKEGNLLRKELADIVFSDPTERKALEAITHPRIRDQVRDEAQRLAKGGVRFAFLEAALLVETGFYQQLDGLLVVTLPEGIQVDRLIARDGCTPEDAHKRISAQLPLSQKTAVADFIIDNSGSLIETQHQVQRLLANLTTQSLA